MSYHKVCFYLSAEGDSFSLSTRNEAYNVEHSDLSVSPVRSVTVNDAIHPALRKYENSHSHSLILTMLTELNTDAELANSCIVFRHENIAGPGIAGHIDKALTHVDGLDKMIEFVKLMQAKRNITPLVAQAKKSSCSARFFNAPVLAATAVVTAAFVSTMLITRLI